jgi:hypothetical protein
MTKSKTDKKTVELGLVYSCKTGGSYVPVRIDKGAGKGRYGGMSMTDGKPVKVHAKDIRGDGQTCRDWHLSKQKTGADDGQEKAQEALKSAAKVASKVLGIPVGVVAPKKAASDAKVADVGAGSKKSAKADKPAKAREKKRPSGLDAAAKVLAEVDEPLNTKQMVERMLAKGLWKTSGRTPASTIYAALIREIAAKGREARFRKVERGKFALAK